MRLSDFDFELPGELVAQRPSQERDAARLLVHECVADRTEHGHVRDLPRHLRPGDLLVLNDTRVLPARVHARRASGGRVELLLLEPLDDPAGPWSAFVQPARKLVPGEVAALEPGRGAEGHDLVARFLERPVGPDGRPGREWIVELARRDGPADTQRLLEAHGTMPLPPYIARPATEGAASALEVLDRERYQTIYARPEALGAVAAPTAGLHFTPRLLAALEARGVRRASVTLHVGAGTFAPVAVEDLARHRMHSERFELGPEAVRAVRETREAGGRVVCVGTTSVRVLESVAAAHGGELRPASGRTELFLRPGSRFHVTDALLSNFHLPRSTLLMLVSAFAGRERVLRLYREAVEARYRFFSYGDAMLLLDPPSL